LFTRPVVWLMLVGGAWSTALNLGLFMWALGTRRSQPEAMTMTFASLVLIQFVNAYNFRSDHVSVWKLLFANRWLNLAIRWELLLLGLVIYLPAAHAPFGAFSLSVVDAAIVALLALTIVPVLELTKWLQRPAPATES
jgi:Ca2+-transporting ATPase